MPPHRFKPFLTAHNSWVNFFYLNKKNMEANKIKRKTFMAIVLAVLCGVLLPEAKAQKIGLLMDSYIIDRWYKDQQYFEEKVKEMGGTCQVENPFGDPHEQIKLAKKLISEKVDALVVIPCDAIKASEIAKMAREAGIPIIAYDRFINSNDLSLYVSYNNEKVGELQAQYALKNYPKGNYLLMNGPISDHNAIQFRKGQLKVLQNSIASKDVKIIGDYIMNDWSEIEALMKVDEYLSIEEEKPTVILSANDALANGSIEALKSYGMEGAVGITGQDADLVAIKNLIAGTQMMTVYKPIKPLATIAAESAMKMARGEKPENVTKMKAGLFEVPSILLEPVVVDKSNYKDTVIKDGHVKEGDLEN